MNRQRCVSLILVSCLLLLAACPAAPTQPAPAAAPPAPTETVALALPTSTPVPALPGPADIVLAAIAPLAPGAGGDAAAVTKSMTFYDDKVVASILGNPVGDFTFDGKAQMTSEYIGLVQNDHMRMAVMDLVETGDTVTGMVHIFGDKAAYYGASPFVLTGEFVVNDGLITKQTLTFTAESAAQLLAGLTSEQVILAFAKQAANPMTVDNVDAYLRFYADDAVYTVPGGPETTQVFSGKPAIRANLLVNDAQESAHTVNNITILAIHGDTVTTRNVSTSDWMQDPTKDAWVATEVFVIKDGLIAADYWEPDPNSVVKAVEVIAGNGYDLHPKPTGDAEITIVQSAVAPWTGDTVTAATVDESLRWYADDATFTILGLPEGIEVYKGKATLRLLMESWVAMHQRWEVEPIMRVRNEVTTRTLTWLDPTVAMGIAPIEATEVWVVSNGLVQSETWVISPASLEALIKAMAAP